MASLGMDFSTPEGMVTFFVIMIWELIWKGLALYRAGKKQQPLWFFFLLIVNSVGILPIVYLLTHRDKKDVKKKRK